MRHFILACAALSLLAACGPSPAANNTPSGTNTGTGTGNGTSTGTGASGTASFTATKSAYIGFLNCAKNRATTADQKAAIDVQIAAIASVPDAAWAQISAQMTANGQAFLAAYGAACTGV